ncbi:hypothetical protein [Companilactobacillus zhachilii]
MAKSAGEPHALSDKEMDEVAVKFGNYGQTGESMEEVQKDIKAHA